MFNAAFAPVSRAQMSPERPDVRPEFASHELISILFRSCEHLWPNGPWPGQEFATEKVRVLPLTVGPPMVMQGGKSL